MKIKAIRIGNFRAFKDETIDLDDYTCFVGANGAGKSTVLCALNVFFREKTSSTPDVEELHEEDFHRGHTNEPVTITVTFVDLNDAAQKEFADYYRNDQLVISAQAVFDATQKSAPVVQHGQRMVMDEFAPFFDAEKAKKKNDELKKVFAELREKFTDLAKASSKADMVAALRSYEASHPALTKLRPSPDEFYGFTGGENRLARHVQWVYVPAVKDAASEQAEAKNTAIGRLLERGVRAKIDFAGELKKIEDAARSSYEAMLASQQGALDTLSRALEHRLGEWAHPDVSLALKWQQDPKKSVKVDEPFAQVFAGEGPFSGNLCRFGHGLQRAYILALLQELASSSDGNQPTLLLAIEEPELYQHPPQCRHLSSVLLDLAEKRSQVMVTTHSPFFVSGEVFENVRLVRKNQAQSVATVGHGSKAKIGELLAKATGKKELKRIGAARAKLSHALWPNVNEIFFSPRLVLCEGREDQAYILTYLDLLGRLDDLRRSGCHVLPVDGKGPMVVPLAVARHLGVATLVVFDSDGHETDEEKRKDHAKDNAAILRLCGIDEPEPFPKDTLWRADVVMWPSEIGTILSAEFDQEKLKPFYEKARVDLGQVKSLTKHPLFIAGWLSEAWSAGMRSPTLQRLCESILAHCAPPKTKEASEAAKSVQAPPPVQPPPVALAAADAP